MRGSSYKHGALGGTHRSPEKDRFMTERQFDGILIDFYGTVCAGDRAAVEAVCRQVVDSCRLPVSPGRLAVSWSERFFDTLESCNHDSFRTLYECVCQSLGDTLKTFNQAPDPAPFVEQLERYWIAPPIYRDAVDFLAAAELPICCVSNADTEPLLTAIEKHDLHFDAIVSSEAARCYKPEPAIFACALDALGIGPDRAVHVGDSLHSDVRGAASLGITTAWICRENRIHDIGFCKPHYTIVSLNELTMLISRRSPLAGLD